MELNRFVRERSRRWERLTALLDKVDEVGMRGLDTAQIDELFSLYRLVSSDLNLAQTRTGNPAILDYLESLVSRAYALLAVPTRPNPFRTWWRIMRHRFPAIMRQQWTMLAIATTAMLLGAAFGWVVTMVSPDASLVFVSAFPDHLSQTPRERVAEAEMLEATGDSGVDASMQAQFSTMLFTHNIRVTVLAFAVGITFGVGTVVLLFYNGTILGSLAYLYFQDGVFEFFVAWVGPHGSIELPCIWFGATAGLLLARAQYNVEGGTFWRQVAKLRPALIDILVGASTFLVLAGLIEGGFSQINEPTIPYPLKITVAGLLFAGLVGYLFFMPVRPTVEERQRLQLDGGIHD